MNTGETNINGSKYRDELKVSIRFAKIDIHKIEFKILIGIAKTHKIIEAMNPKTGSIITKGIVKAAIEYLIIGKKAKNAFKFPK